MQTVHHFLCPGYFSISIESNWKTYHLSFQIGAFKVVIITVVGNVFD